MTEAPPHIVDRIQEFYRAFNSRDIDACLAFMTADVDWHNAMEDKRAIGPDAVREYWTRQFTMISSTVTPGQVRLEGDDVLVTVDQVVRLPSGELRSHSTVTHRFAMRGGLVARFDALSAHG